MVQVLTVKDSSVSQQLLEFIVCQDPDIIVIGFAKKSEEAVRIVQEKKPDVETMDIILQPGYAYIAPEGFQIGVTDEHQGTLLQAPQNNGLCPTVSSLFHSVRLVCENRVIVILLSGMGWGGVEKVTSLQDCGAVTIAQDEKNSLIFGMPAQAFRLGAVTSVFSPEKTSIAVNTIMHSGGKSHAISL